MKSLVIGIATAAVTVFGMPTAAHAQTAHAQTTGDTGQQY